MKEKEVVEENEEEEVTVSGFILQQPRAMGGFAPSSKKS